MRGGIVAEGRVPVAITVDELGAIVVACDDGTVWEWKEGDWRQLGPAIPGTEARPDTPEPS